MEEARCAKPELLLGRQRGVVPVVEVDEEEGVGGNVEERTVFVQILGERGVDERRVVELDPGGQVGPCLWVAGKPCGAFASFSVEVADKLVALTPVRLLTRLGLRMCECGSDTECAVGLTQYVAMLHREQRSSFQSALLPSQRRMRKQFLQCAWV